LPDPANVAETASIGKLGPGEGVEFTSAAANANTPDVAFFGTKSYGNGVYSEHPVPFTYADIIAAATEAGVDVCKDFTFTYRTYADGTNVENVAYSDAYVAQGSVTVLADAAGCTPTPTPPLKLDLNLKLDLGSTLSGAQAVLSGGGLKQFTNYTLEMHSKVVVVYTGVTDKNGNFTELVTMPANSCVSGGKHMLILSGMSPAGKSVTSIQYLVLDAKCKVLAKSKKPIKVVTSALLGNFLFEYNSARLTSQAKRALTIDTGVMKAAKTVTITGYTQTNLTSSASRVANKALAKRRTESVKAFLKRLGVSAKFVLVAKGPVNPVSTSSQHLNRRVTIVVKFTS